jgi:hypothetical protein
MVPGAISIVAAARLAIETIVARYFILEGNKVTILRDKRCLNSEVVESFEPLS